MQVEIRPITTVKPYWRNPRKNDLAVQAVRASIERYGFLQPIVVDSEGVIVAGHTRYRAMMELGAEEVPVVVADLTAEKAKEYRIADNATGDISEWDLGPLAVELRELPDIEAMGDFFPAFDISALVENVSAPMSALPTREQIADTTEARRRQFNEANQRDLKAYVDVVCPNCGEEFGVTRADVAANTSE